MEFFSELFKFLQKELMFVTWKDILEILFFSWVTYRFLRWLSKDKQKNLLVTFYGYCTIAFVSHFAGLNSISLFLLICAPIAALLFIILHQETLQKNFITLKNISSKVEKSGNWIEELIQISLHSASKNKESICIIERTDSLKQFLSPKFRLNADISLESLKLFQDLGNEKKAIAFWANNRGKLVSVNPVWHVHTSEEWISEEIQELEKWKQDATLITEKTDAVIFSLSPVTRLFEIFLEGKTTGQISATSTLSILKKYLGNKKETKNEIIASKNSLKQKLT